MTTITIENLYINHPPVVEEEDEGTIRLDKISVQDLLDGFIKAEWRDETIHEHLQNVITLRRQHLGIPYGYGEYDE